MCRYQFFWLVVVVFLLLMLYYSSVRWFVGWTLGFAFGFALLFWLCALFQTSDPFISISRGAHLLVLLFAVCLAFTFLCSFLSLNCQS